MSLVREMMEPRSSLNNVSLDLQCNKPRFQRQLRAACLSGNHSLKKRFGEIVRFQKHPLTEAEYAKMIIGADVGIMMYDPSRYAVRRAGVLGEFLAAGVPTLVPADCWLSRQIAEPNYQYLDSVFADESLRIGEDRVIAAGDGQTVVIPAATSHVMLSIDSHSGLSASAMSEFRFEDGKGEWTVGKTFFDARANGLPQRCLVLVPDGTTSVRVNLSVDEHQPGALTLSFFRKSDQTPLPLGAIGLAARDQRQFLRFLADISQHHAHYRQHALVFSDGWRSQHAAQETIRQLMSPT